MNCTKQIPEYVLKLFMLAKGIKNPECDYYAWPQVFGSTSGPSGGIGGAAITTFTVEAYVCQQSGITIYICGNCFNASIEHFEPLKYIGKWRKIPENCINNHST